MQGKKNLCWKEELLCHRKKKTGILMKFFEKNDIILKKYGKKMGIKDSGKKILVLERGTFMPQEKENWDTDEVFRKERYHTKEVWKTDGDKELHPGTGYRSEEH